MHAYKFDTIVHEDGIIKIPEIKNLVNHKIEVFIVDKDEVTEKPSQKSFEDFCAKWKGFLKGSNIEKAQNDRIHYLSDKHA